MIKIYHNPRCSKSRETLEILKNHNADIHIVDYLKTPVSFNELKDLLVKLNMKAEDIVRKGESLYKEKFKDKNFNDDEWLTIMVENPVLIERPIIVKGYKAVIGRPPDNVLSLL